MSSFRRKLFDPLAWSMSKGKLIQMMDRARQDVESIVDIPNKYQGRGFYDRIHAEQDPVEIRQLASLVAERKPKVIVEIGTYKGGTLFIWSRVCPKAELIVSLDLPGGQYGGGYDSKREKLYRLFSHGHQNTKMEFIRANSHHQETKIALEKILTGKKIDFLYIDADHTYEGVKTDFELYSPLVSPGGIIGFHDIRNMKENHQVKVFWNELKSRHKHLEILGPETRTGNGIIFL